MSTSHRRPVTGRERAFARWAALPAAIGLVASMPVATWWVVGDQSSVPASENPDYAFRPLAISSGLARGAGIGSMMLFLAAASMLAWTTRRGLIDPRWWWVLGYLLVAGFIAGAAWRGMTAGVIGANIGAGLIIMVGGPVVAALLLAAAAESVLLLLRAWRDRMLAR